MDEHVFLHRRSLAVALIDSKFIISIVLLEKFCRLTFISSVEVCNMIGNFHESFNAYHQNVLKYTIVGKYLQPFKRNSTKYKPEVPKCQMLAANILKERDQHKNILPSIVKWVEKIKFLRLTIFLNHSMHFINVY